VQHIQRDSTPEEQFGQLVRAGRERRGWSQEMLSRRLRDLTDAAVDQSGIARIEAGRRAIRLNEVAALSEVLNIDLRMFGKAMARSEAEEMNMALAEATERLHMVTGELVAASTAAESARVALDDAVDRVHALQTQRGLLQAERDQLTRQLHQIADARRQFELETRNGE
jgi:transcriptional regulator with XRE-family HTH domain